MWRPRQKHRGQGPLLQKQDPLQGHRGQGPLLRAGVGPRYPLAQHGQLAFLDGQEAQPGPALAGGVGAAEPDQVRARVDRHCPAGAVDDLETQLIQRVLAQRRAGDQQHAGFGNIADPADGLLGHRVENDHRFVDIAALRAARFVDHASAPALAASLAPAFPEKLRRALTVACQARSIRRPLPWVTTRTWSRAIKRARLSSDCSPRRWPRWFTNRALSVTGLYQDRRWRVMSPCWLMANSNQVPNGSVRR